MISLSECKDFAGLVLDELILGTGPTEAHRAKLSAYELNMKWGAETVRELIIGDIRVARDLGAARLAADLLVVLRMFLHEHPEARRTSESLAESRKTRAPRLNHNARMPCKRNNSDQVLVKDPLF
jgi:hypothetical protein